MRKIKHMHDVSRLRELFKYDPVAGALTRIKTGKPCGTLVSTGHLTVWFDGRGVGVHRIAWALAHGEYPSIEVDHINGDGADNRLCNLRLATSSENNQNRRMSSRNKSGVKGVFWFERNKRWRGVVGFRSKYHIKDFKEFDDAVQFVTDLRSKLHAEFGNDGFKPLAEAA